MTRIRLAAVVLLAAGLAACSGSDERAKTPPAASATTVDRTTTTTTKPPRPTPNEIPGSLLEGDVAFLGPIFTVPVGDITMAYRQFGVGSDLVLINGQAAPMSVWPASMLRALAQRYRVTIYDNRDLGDTTDTTEQFTLSDLADDAARLTTVLGIDHPAVFGWSTGGEIGLLLAVRHPGLVASLAITGATPGGSQSVLPSPDVIELFASPAPDLAKLFDALFSPGAEARSSFLADLAMVPQPSSSADAASKYDFAEKAYWSGAEPNLDAITIPVLVMNGAADDAVPSANATYIADRLGDTARLELDPGGRHGWFIEHPDHFLALLTSAFH